MDIKSKNILAFEAIDLLNKSNLNEIEKSHIFQLILNDKPKDFLTSNSYTSKVKNKPILSLLVGPPCSRKSSWIKDNYNNEIVLSRDELVYKVGAKKGLNYADTFKFLEQNPDIKFNEIEKVLINKAKKAKDNMNNVIVDMTNMTKESRIKWIDLFPDYEKKAYIFLTSVDNLIDCNKKRSIKIDKKIPNNAILNMINKFQLPVYNEGFSNIEYLWI